MADPTFAQILAIADDHFQGGANVQPGVNAVNLAGAIRRLAGLGGAGGTQADLIFDPATELTIAAGVIAASQAAHTVDTEADAASDILDSITGGTAEELLLIRPANAARTIVIANAVGADLIACPGAQSISLAEVTDFAMLYYDGTQWIVVGYSTRALGGGGLGLALASTANALGASLVGIEDAAGDFAATDVEAALAEAKALIDAGTADHVSLKTAPTLTPAAEAANVIAVTFASPLSAAEQYIAEVMDDATMEPSTAVFSIAETGVGAEISPTARARLIFTTDASGDATLSVTDVAGASSKTAFLLVRPLHDSAEVRLQVAPVEVSIAFDGV